MPDVQLLRVVVDPDNPMRIIADPVRRMPGRGAWITPTEEAVELAVKRKAFSRALKVSGTVDASPVREYVVTVAQAAEMQTQRRCEHNVIEGPKN
ncbi:YlxR family protein [Corynebacterium aquatimens]